MGFLGKLKGTLMGEDGLVEVFAAESVGKGLDRLFQMADGYYLFNQGMYPHERPSTWLSLLGGILTPEFLAWVRPQLSARTADEIGAYPMTNLWDYLEEYWALYNTPVPTTTRESKTKARPQTKKKGFPGVSYNGRYVKTG